LTPSPIGTPAIAAASDETDDVDRSITLVCAEGGGIRIARESTTRRKAIAEQLHL
jgi:hypothetical protein